MFVRFEFLLQIQRDNFEYKGISFRISKSLFSQVHIKDVLVHVFFQSMTIVFCMELCKDYITFLFGSKYKI